MEIGSTFFRSTKSFLQRVLVAAGLLSLMATASGCGKNPNEVLNDLVVGANIHTSMVDGEPKGEVTVLINNHGVRLPSFSAKIRDSRHPQDEFGVLSMRDTFAEVTELAFELNLNHLGDATKVDNRLPNNRKIPVGGLGNTPVFSIPVGDTQARVYTAFGTGVALLGVAVPIVEMDEIGDNVSYLDVFPTFTFGDVRGIAGIFTGKNEGENGIAVFIDASKLVQSEATNILTSEVEQNIAGSHAVESFRMDSQTRSQLYFVDIRPTGKRVDRLYQEIYELRQSGRRLHVHE